MAYIKDAPRPKCWCGKRATKELYNRRDSLVGQFCAPHAEGKLKEAQASEETQERWRSGGS